MSKIIWANAPQFLVWSRLRSLRQSINLTQVQVSAGAGVPIMTLSFLERGYIEPSQTIKRKLCDFFQVGEQGAGLKKPNMAASTERLSRIASPSSVTITGKAQ